VSALSLMLLPTKPAGLAFISGDIIDVSSGKKEWKKRIPTAKMN
jgi:hypothetical protein